MELLSELNDAMKSDQNEKKPKVFIIVVRYNEAGIGGCAWEGKIKMVTKAMKVHHSDLSSKIQNLSAEIKTLLQEMKKN